MSVNVDLAQHGLSEAEQLAVFEFMNRGQQVRWNRDRDLIVR
jgi:hypothetical protein